MQSRRHSIIESVTNVTVGYLCAVLSQIIIFPIFDIHIPVHQNFVMGLWFTCISVVRSYALRRWFTRRTES
jgi:hypothetical protein